MYQCFVQALYNLQYVQALAIITCKFSDEERRAWHKGVHSDSMATLESLMGHVIQLLGDSRLYEDDADADPHVPAVRIFSHFWGANLVS